MAKVKITEHHFLKRSKPRLHSFDTYSDFQLKFTGPFGFDEIKQRHADLLDIALAIYHFEKMQSRTQPSNPLTHVEMDIWLREPDVWNQENLDVLSTCLQIMGNAKWTIKVYRNRNKQIYPVEKMDLNIERVTLFSGGVDSTAGIATLSRKEIERTLLFSFYSRQKSLQRAISQQLGFDQKNHVQFWYRVSNQKLTMRNRSFFYRSLLFLFLASILADSHQCPELIQFENGVLATSIPPTPSMIITKHAHPQVHQQISKLMSNIFGKPFLIQNPFLPLTKRECVEKAYASVGQKKFDELLKMTETCWFKYSNFDPGGEQKEPNQECGFCIPCIIKRTAVPGSPFVNNLNSVKGRRLRNTPAAEGFRSYFAFTQKILQIKRGSTKAEADFFKLLPPAGRLFYGHGNEFSFDNPPKVIYRLFSKFADEFHQTFT